MTRIFRTSIDVPTEELKARIGSLVCDLITPFIFEIVELKQESNLYFTMTCKVTGKETDIGKQFLKEQKKDEE